MRRTIPVTLLALLMLSAASGYGQTLSRELAAPPALVAWVDEPGDQEGPDHDMYKKGYDLVLSEKWEAATKQFAELLQKYPKSDFADDARYWSAYALMHTDLKKALTNYKEFVNKHPKSTYYDDAVADMANIQAQLEVAQATKAATNSQMHHPGVIATPHPSAIPQIWTLDSKLRHMNRSLRLMNNRVGNAFAYSMEPLMADEKRLDAKTRLKLDALQAIGDNNQDEKGFATLKDIALDTKQPIVLRRAALNLLPGFENQDVDGVYMAIVQKDTSEEMQVAAIENIGQSGKDKDKTVETLVQLYSTLPTGKGDQRSAALYRIADVGNDRAVDFLTKVAKSDSDYDMRSDAVYYLGNIGGEKARAVLYDILKGE